MFFTVAVNEAGAADIKICSGIHGWIDGRVQKQLRTKGLAFTEEGLSLDLSFGQTSTRIYSS